MQVSIAENEFNFLLSAIMLIEQRRYISPLLCTSCTLSITCMLISASGSLFSINALELLGTYKKNKWSRHLSAAELISSTIKLLSVEKQDVCC